MALETVVVVASSATWTLVSNASVGRFRAQVLEGVPVLFSIGATAPAADLELGMPAVSLNFDALDGKVWVRGAGTDAKVAVARVVDAGNPAIPMVAALALSSASFTELSVAGTVIGTISNRVVGSKIEVSPNDGRFAISDDGTTARLVVGLSASKAGTTPVTITETSRLAANSPRRTKFSVVCTAAVARLPVLINPAAIAVEGGGPLRVNSVVVATRETYTNTEYEPFQYYSNFDAGDSAVGPWRQQGAFGERFILAATELNGSSMVGKYIRYRSTSSNAFGPAVGVITSNVVGPVAAALIPGQIIPYDAVRQVNAGNIQRGVAFSYPLLHGQPDWSVEMDPLTGVSITGGSNSATATWGGTIPATGGNDEIVDVWFTCKKAGQPDQRTKWVILVSDNLYVPDLADTVTGGLIVDENTALQSYNQTAKTSKSLTRTVGRDGQTVWRLVLLSDGVGWNGDGTFNKYRSELQFLKQFGEGEEFDIAFRDLFIGGTQVDLTTPGSAYLIAFQGQKNPTAGAEYVPPPMEAKILWDAGVRKLQWSHGWNNEDGLKNLDIFVGVTKVVAGSLNVINFYDNDGVTPKKVAIKNGMAVSRNLNNAPNVNDPPDGVEVVNGGWDGVTDTGVTSVTVSANLTAATRQLLFKTNYHTTKSPAIAFPSGWHDFSYRGRYSLTGNGFFEVKMDGVTVYSVSNIYFGYKHVGTDKPYYFKGGAYTSPKPGLDLIHHIEAPLISGAAIPGLGGRLANPFATLASSAVVTRTKDGSVGQTYSAAVTPSGSAIQWVRTTLGPSPVTTGISGATATTYVATSADVNTVLGVRPASGGSVIGKFPGPVLAAPIMLADFESLTGWSTGAFALSLDTTNKVQGTSSLLVANTDGGTSSPITEKAISGIDPSTLDIVVAAIYQDNFSENTFELSYRRNNISAGIVGNGGTHGTINADNLPQTVRFVTAAIADNTSVPTGVADGVIRARIVARDPLSARLRFDSFMGNAGGRPTLVWTFDDGFRGPYTRLLPKFDEYGWKATFFIPDQNIRTTISDGSRLLWDDVRDIDARGHDVACDTPNDSGYDQHITPNGISDAVAWYQQTRAALVSQGISNRALDHLCYPNGLYKVDPLYSRISSATSNGTATITFAAGPVISTSNGPVAAGMTLVDGFWGEVGQAKILAVAGDGLSVTMDRNIAARTAKPIMFGDVSGVLYQRKLMTALKAAGVKTGRATGSITPEHMSTRFGFPDLSALCMPAKGFTNEGLTQMKAYIDDCFKFKSTNIMYLHDAIPDSQATQGINVYASAVLSAMEYAYTTYVQPGNMDVLSTSQVWTRDSGSGVPF